MTSRQEAFLLPLFPRLICKTMLVKGFVESEIFAGLDLSMRDLESESFRLSIDQHESLILRLMQLANDEHLALRLSKWRDTNTTNLTILAIANSGQISRALDAITRYFKTITRVFSVTNLNSVEGIGLELDVHLTHPKVVFFAVTSFALFLDAFFADALDAGTMVKKVTLPVPAPTDMKSVQDAYAFELEFSAERTRVLIYDDVLDAPMPIADPVTVRLLNEVCERQLREAEAETSFVGRVKWLLVNRVGSPPRLEDAAQQVGISSRGLRRRLAESGTTYQSLLDDVRYSTASRMLRDSDARVSSIAYELGYGTPSDFSRAFRRWSGMTPSDYREAVP